MPDLATVDPAIGDRAIGGVTVTDAQVMEGLFRLYFHELYMREIREAYKSFVNRNQPTRLQLRSRTIAWQRQRFESFLRRHEAVIVPVLRRQDHAWQAVRAQSHGYLAEFERVLTAWVAARHGVALPTPESIDFDPDVAAPLGGGAWYAGPASGYNAKVHAQRARRILQTLKNVASGPLGALGYLLGGHEGSDLGALVDGLTGAAGRTAGARTQNKVISQPPDQRPVAAQIAPATGSRGTASTAVGDKGTSATVAGPKTPTPPSPSPPTPVTGGPSKPPPAGGGKRPPGSGGSGSPPNPPGPVDRAIDKLRARRVDVDDPYTRTKLREICTRYKDPEAFFKTALAGVGELRVMMRAVKEPGVAKVRFLEPGQQKGDRTPDIEIEYIDGRRTYVEVRTMTEAPQWNKIKHGAHRSKLAATPEFVQSLEAKIHHGQISANRQGILALHAPRETVNATALEGWREILNQIGASRAFPNGLNAIVVTGGTGNQRLVFEAPDWQGQLEQ